MLGAAVMWLAAATGLLPMAFSTADTRLGPWITPWWVSVGGLVVLATVLAYVSGIMAARALGSKVASFVALTEVLFAVAWAWLLLGELPGAIQLLGGALIVGGVILVRLDELRSLALQTTPGTEGGAPRPKVPSPLDHANDVEPVP
jgi:drug/metabolite transporter (DMT)-like permease